MVYNLDFINILMELLHYSQSNTCNVCTKETSQRDAPFKQTKHISARKPAIQLKYALTFCQSVCYVCLNETSP